MNTIQTKMGYVFWYMVLITSFILLINSLLRYFGN